MKQIFKLVAVFLCGILLGSLTTEYSRNSQQSEVRFHDENSAKAKTFYQMKGLLEEAKSLRETTRNSKPEITQEVQEFFTPPPQGDDLLYALKILGFDIADTTEIIGRSSLEEYGINPEGFQTDKVIYSPIRTYTASLIFQKTNILIAVLFWSELRINFAIENNLVKHPQVYIFSQAI